MKTKKEIKECLTEAKKESVQIRGNIDEMLNLGWIEALEWVLKEV